MPTVAKLKGNVGGGSRDGGPTYKEQNMPREIDESKLPPRPTGDNGPDTDPDSPLVRYGRASKESGLLLEPMADGYWTPWHIANEMLRAAQAKQTPCRPGSRCERRALGMEPCVAGECRTAPADGVPEVLPERGNTQCNPHPDAPHGFNRNSSHSAARYVCDCEEWAPDGVGGRKP